MCLTIKLMSSASRILRVDSEILILCVSVSYCCCNKLPQNQWLNTNLFAYSSGGQNPNVGPKLKVWAGLCPLWRFWGDSFA